MDKRSRWFDDGASALRLFHEKRRPGDEWSPTEDYYACPCCLVAHPRAAVTATFLTYEDVPPKALGGRRMLLTCHDCNSSSGTNFDGHAVKKVIADAFARGAVTPKHKAIAYIDGIPLRGTAQSTGNEISLVSDSKQNHPKEEAAFGEAMDSLAEEGFASHRFSLTVNTRFDEWRARFSWIRAAYLAAFAGLGWSYILRPELRPIRDQLKSPGTQLLETYILHDSDSQNSANRLLLVTDPYELRSVAVILGEYIVFLPGWQDPLTWDELGTALYRRREVGDRLNLALNGKEVPWPKQPMYLLDRLADT